MNTLKPCPFCGKMPEVADDGVCRCNNKSCLMAPYWYLPKYWNTRPIEDNLRNRIAELEADNAEFRQLIRDWSIVLEQNDEFQLWQVESVRQAMLEINKECEE